MEKLGNRRVTGLEQYYTPKSLALSLVETFLSRHPDLKDAAFLEPAGGTGAFIDALQAHGLHNVQSVDTHPHHKAVSKANFLEFVPTGENWVTISNPPFGRNNALSIPFFNHAANFSSHIGFLVPRSWRKWSVINRLDPRFHLTFDQDVDLIYVDQDENPLAKSNGLRTCFQIWERKSELREKFSVPESGLIEKCSPNDADVAIRVFGFGCGQVLENFERKPNTTLMFLRIQQPATARVLSSLDFSRFKNNTAYTQALSFQEINFLLNERLFGDGRKIAKG